MSIFWLALALAQDPAPSTAPEAPSEPASTPAEGPAPASEPGDEPSDELVAPAPMPAPVVPAAPAPAPEPADDEIIVYGQLAIDKARDALIRDMERLGWRAIDRGDGVIDFRGAAGWMGRARFDPEMGSLDFRRPVAGFRLADYDEPSVSLPPGPTGPDGMTNDAPMSSGAGFWLLPRKKKVDAAWNRVREATQDELGTYQKVVFATAFEERLQLMPERLDALWTAGVPLEGGAPVLDEAARRAAILDFWAGRANTPEGLRMSKAVEAWIGANLTMTDAEAKAAEARRQDGRTLPR